MTDLDLLTVEDRVRLLVNALSDEEDSMPVLKLFTPDANATWLISECDPDDPDRLFGLCDLGLGFPELGWVSWTELKSVRGRLGLPIERDIAFVGEQPLSVYAEAARKLGRIQV